MKPFVQKALLLYSATLSTVFAVVMVSGAKSQRNAEFDEIRTHRLNIIEPDGTLRMVISDHGLMPGVIVKGKEFPKVDRPEAGMLFYNDEGTENTASLDRLCSLPAWTTKITNSRDWRLMIRLIVFGWDAGQITHRLYR